MFNFEICNGSGLASLLLSDFRVPLLPASSFPGVALLGVMVHDPCRGFLELLLRSSTTSSDLLLRLVVKFGFLIRPSEILPKTL